MKNDYVISAVSQYHKLTSASHGGIRCYLLGICFSNFKIFEFSRSKLN